ncbi:protein NETWORKED 3A [Neltuma alba]|uniref:protein NETWORKED 3A n=1 Tax=Neltuma alba TaxID=207710 RepID=UPI0010A509DA|nr:protein NETWORKED 3A-like [Prosopis alba]XP_028804218.1 protein NETWORKED 3A-like [Prosopis alba]
MAQMRMNQPSHWWWLDDHSASKRTPWLQSTLSELNEKTKAMLKLIEQDADSFAQRAEMYYKKRPELIRMVEDFYRTQRSLAERYDQVKPDSGFRLLISGGSPFASAKYQSEKFMTFTDTCYDSFSENCDVEESAESEVDDPEQEEESEFDKKGEVPFVAVNDEAKRLGEEIKRLEEENKVYKDQVKQKDAMRNELMTLREEIERLREENREQKDQLKKKDAMSDEAAKMREEIGRLREENRAQKDELRQKDEEKIEVIKHLSLAIDVIKQENSKMRNFIAKDCNKKWKHPFELNKLMGALSGKLFNGYPWNQPSVIAL